MTFAICIACGAEKFGAFVACSRCGYAPEQVLDKAKSLILSDHHFPPSELSKCGRSIEAGRQIPFDPVSLASCAEPIIEQDYFWDRFDASQAAVPCMKCGKSFKPDLENVLCPDCFLESEETFVACVRCIAIFDIHARFCHHCGSPITIASRFTTKVLGTNLALSVRRLMTAHIEGTFDKMSFLGQLRSQQAPDEREASERELEALCLFAAILVLRKFTQSTRVIVKAVRQMTGLYKLGATLLGADSASADGWEAFLVRRFDRYDGTIGANPEKWMLHLSNEAAKACFRVGEDIRRQRK